MMSISAYIHLLYQKLACEKRFYSGLVAVHPRAEMKGSGVVVIPNNPRACLYLVSPTVCSCDFGLGRPYFGISTTFVSPALPGSGLFSATDHSFY